MRRGSAAIVPASAADRCATSAVRADRGFASPVARTRCAHGNPVTAAPCRTRGLRRSRAVGSGRRVQQIATNASRSSRRRRASGISPCVAGPSGRGGRARPGPPVLSRACQAAPPNRWLRDPSVLPHCGKPAEGKLCGAIDEARTPSSRTARAADRWSAAWAQPRRGMGDEF